MLQNNDLDNPEDIYPVNGTLEEKAAYGLEQVRQAFYWQKRAYEENKEGGPRHAAMLLAHGPKTAERTAQHAEAQFKAYCANAMVTFEGESTDPRYPNTKLINRELRRIRQVIILTVSQYMYQFEALMPEDMHRWENPLVFKLGLEGFVNRYRATIYFDINTVIPNKKLPPPALIDVSEFLDMLCVTYSKPVEVRQGRRYIVERMRDRLIEFLLVDIPYNKERLDGKVALIADEKAKPKEEEKPVLH